ncbi:DUF945 family protein [Thorsellia kenyensis]|uniref:DUF945 family protein n=1 Tax=Thorsellia kenyensis TaxID=1549888 RepID=A0ABV6C9J3_9GAMM
MKTQSKSKKSLVAVGVLAAITLGWLGTTYTISNSVEQRLGNYVETLNQQVQSEDLFFVKPKFILKEVNSSFFKSDFIISVEIENFKKFIETQKLKSRKATSNAEFSEEYFKEEEARIKALPDFIKLFDVKNIATHGPFPKITEFNFTPGVMSIDSVTTYNDLNAEVKNFTKSLKLDDKTLASIENHQVFSANTMIPYSKSISTTLQASPFDWTINNTVIKYEGLNLTFNGAADFDLNIKSGKIGLTDLPSREGYESEEAFKKALAQVEENFTLNGLTFVQKRQSGDITTGSINLSFEPIQFKALSSETDENQKPLWNTLSFEGLDVNYERSKNDGLTFNEKANLIIKPATFNAVEYDYWNDGTKVITGNSSVVEMVADSKSIPNGFLLAGRESYKADFKLIREALSTGDLEVLIKLNNWTSIAKTIELYRQLAGTSTAAIKPFEINVKEESSDPVDLNIKLGEISTTFSRESTDTSKPLVLSAKLNSLDAKETNKNFHISLKDYSLSSTIPLQNFYPFNIDYSIGNTSFNIENRNIFTTDNMRVALGLVENEKSVDIKQHFSGKNILVNSVDFGSFELNENLENFNKESFNQLQDVFIESLKLALSNQDLFTPPQDIFIENLMAKAPASLEGLLSNGLIFNKSPNTFSSKAGKTDLSLVVKLKPITNQSIAEASSSIDSAVALIENLNFSLDADINYLADTGAKFQLLAFSGGETPEAEMIDSTRMQFAGMIPQMISSSPAASIINVTEDKLSSKIEVKDGKITVNGQEMTPDEILGLLGL